MEIVADGPSIVHVWCILIMYAAVFLLYIFLHVVNPSFSLFTSTFCFQVCLAGICEWSLTWQLRVSSQKCCVIDVDKSVAADDRYPCPIDNEGLACPKMCVTKELWTCGRIALML